MECFVYLQGEQCHNLAAQLKKQYPDMAAPVLIEAAQFVKEKKADQAQKLLNVGVLLLLSQFYNFFPKIFNILDVLVLFLCFSKFRSFVEMNILMYLHLVSLQKEFIHVLFIIHCFYTYMQCEFVVIELLVYKFQYAI